MIRRLRVKFVVINMTIVLVMLTVIFGTVFTMTARNMQNASIAMMESIAKDPLQIMRLDENRMDMALPYFSLELDRNGNLRARESGFFDLSDDAFLRELVQQVAVEGNETGILKQYRLRYLRSTTPFGERVVFADMSNEYSTMEDLMGTCSVIALGSLIVFLFISIGLSFWAVRPVERAWQQQKQFVADASHELKTPLTVILTNAELMQNSNDPLLQENVLKMSLRMKSLVESLLALARVDDGIPKEQFSDLELSSLVYDAALTFDPLFYEKGLRLETIISPQLLCRGSEQHLSQLTGILLDNAMKYSHFGGITYLRLVRTGKRSCLLSVSNPGSPLTEKECQDIFKRFYRRDTARTPDGSFGLGLSIAQGIVRRHGGKIWAESNNGFNSFYVQLPTK